MTNKEIMAIRAVEANRKAADFYKPARLLMESLYGGKWRTIKAKLPRDNEYYMVGVRELIERADAIKFSNSR